VIQVFTLLSIEDSGEKTCGSLMTGRPEGGTEGYICGFGSRCNGWPDAKGLRAPPNERTKGSLSRLQAGQVVNYLVAGVPHEILSSQLESCLPHRLSLYLAVRKIPVGKDMWSPGQVIG
jgi:hypothetical protein